MLDETPILDIKPYLSSVPLDRLRRRGVDEPRTKAEQLE